MANQTDNSSTATSSPKESINIVITTTVVFCVIEALSCGSLLVLLLTAKRRVSRYTTLIQNLTLSSILVKAIVDLSLRLPLVMLGSDNVSPAACVVMTEVPDFVHLAILLALPLISAERLSILVFSSLRRGTLCRTFAILACGPYTCGLAITLLPAITSLFADGTNSNLKCGGIINYGTYGFAYLYTAAVALVSMLTIVFSCCSVIALRLRLRAVSESEQKKRRMLMERGVVTSSVMTITLFFATVPFALTLQAVIICGSTERRCPTALPTLFRVSVIIQRLSYALLPVLFIVFNPPLRKRIHLLIKQIRRHPASTSHVSTSSEKLSSEAVIRTTSRPTMIGEQDQQQQREEESCV